MAERLVVALVRGAHGLRGAVRVEILTDHPELRYAPGQALFREGDERALTIDWSSPIADGPGWRVHFREVGNRSSAEELKGIYLESLVGAEAPLARGEYFWHEVVGATVSGIDGTILGTVKDVYRSGGAEIYTVTGGEYGEFDVPGVRPFVRVFAPRRGEIVIDAEALDLTPPKRRGDESRPKAPRRRPRSRSPKAVGGDTDTNAGADAATPADAAEA
jgi:16S rRNA processing protein RimM